MGKSAALLLLVSFAGWTYLLYSFFPESASRANAFPLCNEDRDNDGKLTGKDCKTVPGYLLDCDDNNRYLWKFTRNGLCRGKCLDTDGDGFYRDCDVFPRGEEDDCDLDPLNWKEGHCRYVGHTLEEDPGSTCVDLDGDGFYGLCDSYSKDVRGPDCSDEPSSSFSIDNWKSCKSCKDSDSDGYFSGCDRYSGESGLEWDSDDGETFEKPYDLLIVVNRELEEIVGVSLSTYVSDIRKEGITARTLLWEEGSAEELRRIVLFQKKRSKIKGLFFIGDIPSAWFEMETSGKTGYVREEFPTDLYFADPDSTWEDFDGNGIYDDHSALEAELYISRLVGQPFDIRDYLNKAHRYRVYGRSLPQTALLFKDDDWKNIYKGYSWGLGSIYRDLTIYDDPKDSTYSNYMKMMKGEGVEYLYMWLHASPGYLEFDRKKKGKKVLTADEIKRSGLKGSFFNLFSCSAARFTQKSVGEAFLHTTHGLAVVGSTKVGGMYCPFSFHEALSEHVSWAEALRLWYNRFGYMNDSWHLGVVSLGDPLLKLKRRDPVVSTDSGGGDSCLNHKLVIENEDANLGSFEQYRKEYPHFFR